MFGAIAGGIASALAGGAMSKLFGGGQKARSEERRVGKECRSRGAADDLKKDGEQRERRVVDERPAAVDVEEPVDLMVFFFKQKTAYEIGLGIPAEPLFRSNQVIKEIICLQPLK